MEYTVLLNANPQLDPSNNITGVVGVGQDVTQLLPANEAAKAMAKDFMNLVENANAPVIGVGSSMEVMEWNSKVALMLGVSKDEAMGKDFVKTFVKPYQQDAVQEILQQTLLDGSTTSNYELQLVSTSGMEYTVLLNANPRLDPNNNIVGVVGVGQDVTQMLKANQAAAAVAKDFMNLVGNANAPIIGVGSSMEVMEWNTKVATMLGVSKDE